MSTGASRMYVRLRRHPMQGREPYRARSQTLNASERREFVRTHRTAVFGYQRKADGPAMSIVYYVMDGDDILVSTMRARGKAGAVRRNPKGSLCILDEQWPPTYVAV